MIKSKQDLEKYLLEDKIALYKSKQNKPKFMSDEIWRFQILYRKLEYYSNCVQSFYTKICRMYYKIKTHKKAVRLGFSIPINVFDAGLSIAHYGTLVVNGSSKVGKNCRIQENVTLGATNGTHDAPIIGNNVFIGSGAKIIGKVRIADDVCIGAGSVVVKDVLEKGITVAGVPAKKISENDSHSNLNPELFNGVM